MHCQIFWTCLSELIGPGLPTAQAFKELDYVGAILFIASATLILVGIVYTTTLPSKDPKVIGTLVSGFIALVAFALWETFAPLKQPLTPTHVFTRDKGRELTAPFIVGFVVTMFYYAVNIICKCTSTNRERTSD
jgi:hypothetical membrane protein